MRFVADEDVDRPIVVRLRVDGHDVLHVLEQQAGIKDSAVLQIANEAEAILITQDKDFGDLVFRQCQVHCGVILIRLPGVPPDAKAQRVSDIIHVHHSELEDAFTVIGQDAVRIRRAPQV